MNIMMELDWSYAKFKTVHSQRCQALLLSFSKVLSLKRPAV
jgi:hypothetical protein